MKIVNPYERLGVRTFINCCGTRTIHSGTLMWAEVREAMMAASHHFVNMDDLMDGVGRRLSELTGAEWGMVSSGAAAALCHATAACVTGGDPELMLRLPNTRGLKHRVLMMTDGRFTYDHAIRSVGVDVVNVSPDALGEALDDRVAMIALLGSRESTRMDVFEKTVARARSRGIPVLVDAASEYLQNPDPYLAMGATMVAYSGGKYLRGPQATGLLLGEKKWVQTAWRCAAPHHTLGRPMKVGKEEVMGVLAAVEYWAQSRDHRKEHAEWEMDLRIISEAVEKIGSVTTEVIPGESERSPVPRLAVRWDNRKWHVSGLQLRDQLLSGTPSIMLDDRGATDCSVNILPFSLQIGDARVVGECIAAVLANAAAPQAGDVAEPVDASGRWEVEIEFTDSRVAHQFVIAQKEGVLSGTHRTVFLEGALTGKVVGSTLTVESQIPYEGTHLAYRFTGFLEGDSVQGEVELGSCGQSAPGPLNQREYGRVGWKGRRVT
ncbi:MAG: PLP-dependent transferase [bacterium]|nr:PLP-dependent transferase [bacterium]